MQHKGDRVSYPWARTRAQPIDRKNDWGKQEVYLPRAPVGTGAYGMRKTMYSNGFVSAPPLRPGPWIGVVQGMSDSLWGSTRSLCLRTVASVPHPEKEPAG